MDDNNFDHLDPNEVAEEIMHGLIMQMVSPDTGADSPTDAEVFHVMKITSVVLNGLGEFGLADFLEQVGEEVLTNGVEQGRVNASVTELRDVWHRQAFQEVI